MAEPEPLHDIQRGPLCGLRVLEIGGGIPAAACGRLLRGFGAETVRYELPDQRLTADEEVFYLAGGRRVDASAADLRNLVEEADVLIEDQPPGWLAAQGLDPVALRRSYPELIITSISPFGQTGPQARWQTTSAVQFAVGGLMSLTGESHREPLVTGGDQAHVLGGLHAFAATAAVAAGRQRHGVGDWIDLSMQECAASMPELYAAMSEYETGEPVVRMGNSVRATWGVYRCDDGYAGVCCLARQLPALFALIGEPVISDPRFADRASRAENDDELLAHVMGFMSTQSKDGLLALSPQHRVPFGAVKTPLELLDDPSYRERQFLDGVKTGDRSARQPGRPFLGLPWTSPDRLQGVNEQGAQIWSGSGWRSAMETGKSGCTVEQRPLNGVRILDLSMMWAGPYATKLLAELGAEVIKIESPSAWDNIRTLVPQDPSIEDPWNSAYYFNEYNHSKKSLTLDLAQQEGRRIFLQLVAGADVVIENYRADVMDNLGLGYDVLREANERIVLVSMAGFGKTGPLRNHVGFGPIIEMMSGLMSLTGYGDDDVPTKTGVSYGDPIGGLNAVAAVALSLIQRQQTDKGTHIDMAQTETASSMAGPAFVAASLRAQEPRHQGNRHPRFVPQGCYPTAGDDQWLVLSIRDDDDWGRLCQVIERDDLAALSWSDRLADHDGLDVIITDWLVQRNGADAQRVLQEAALPAGVVLDTLAIHDDPQLVDRDFYQEVPHPKMRSYRQTGPTWRLTDALPHPMRRSPFFGEHNAELLAELGLTAADLAALAAADVIANAPINPSVG